MIVKEKQGNTLVEVDSVNCVSPYWNKDPNGRLVYVTCNDDRGVEKQRLSLQIIGKPFERERYYSFEGACGQISIWNVASIPDSNSVRFELVTDCQSLLINERRWTVYDGAKRKERGMYMLLLDKDWLVRDLKVAATSN